MRVRRVAIVVGLVALSLVPGAPAHAKSLTVARLEQDITIARDGSFLVEERRTVDFEGSFRRLFLTFPAGPWSFDDVSVGEGARAYLRVSEPGAEVPGTYLAERDDGALTIRWYVSAADERRTFTIRYRVDDQIVRGDDVAEFYWKFVGGDSDVASGNIAINVYFPGRTPDVRVWGHGPLEGEVEAVRLSDGSVEVARWTVPRLPPRTFLEGRMTFPPSLVPGARYEPGARLPGILAEEQALADEANRARAFARFWNLAAPIGALLSLAFFVWLFVRYGREHDAPDPGPYARELPAEYPPAIVGYLMRFGSVKPVDMVATLMDLARRGYLTIGETRTERGLLVKKPHYDYRIRVLKTDGPDLSRFERDVLELLTEASSSGGVSDDELTAWAEANPARMRSRFTAFSSAVQEYARGLRLIEPRAGIIAANIGAVALAGLITVLAVSAQVGPGTPLDVIRYAPGAVVAVALLIAQVAASPSLRRRSIRGVRDFAGWKAFRRFLTDLSRIGEYRPTAVGMWEQYLVYAVPLGVADEVARAITIHAPPEIQSGGLPWLVMSPDSGGASFAESVGSFATSFTASASAAFGTAPSSGGGSGGGSSGGGGGGGGGGSFGGS